MQTNQVQDVKRSETHSLELLQESVSNLTTYYQEKLKDAETQIINLKAENESLSRSLVFREGKYTFLESSASCLSRHHAMEISNRDAEMKFLRHEWHTTLSSVYNNMNKDELQTVLSTREKQLERMASQLDFVNSQQQRLTEAFNAVAAELHECEQRVVSLQKDLQQEKMVSNKLLRQSQILEKSAANRKVLATVDPPGSLTRKSDVMTESALIFISDLRAETQQLLEDFKNGSTVKNTM